MKSKTIIISAENKSGRGILTLSLENELLACKLRLYGVEKLNRYAKIGIFHNNEVYTANLIERDGVYLSSLVGNFDMEKDFYAAIIKTDNANEVLLSGGTYAGYYFNDNSIFSEQEKVEKPDENETICEQHDENETADLACDKCANCKYKEYFYSQNTTEAEMFNPEPEKIETATAQEKAVEPGEEKPSNIPSIIEQIVPQFEYIFKNYPENAEINALIKNGKFVSIPDGDYSLGAIYDDDKIKLICYAVKSNYNTPAPEELGKFYQWLPLDKDDPLSDGYYIVFQDASDLKIIEV